MGGRRVPTRSSTFNPKPREKTITGTTNVPPHQLEYPALAWQVRNRQELERRLGREEFIARGGRPVTPDELPDEPKPEEKAPEVGIQEPVSEESLVAEAPVAKEGTGDSDTSTKTTTAVTQPKKKKSGPRTGATLLGSPSGTNLLGD